MSQQPEQKFESKKHLARQQKEQKQQKVLLFSLIIVIAAIILLITWGILQRTVFLGGRTVATVNDQKITVEQFRKRVSFDRTNLINNFVNYQLSGFGAYFQDQLLEVQNQLDDYVQFGSDTLDQMINEKLIIQAAKDAGITVTDEEVSKVIKEKFGFYENGTPTPAPTFEIKPTSTLSSTQLAMVTLVPTATETPAATLEPTVTGTPEAEDAVETEATETESETPAETATPTATVAVPTNTPTIEPTATLVPPTATPYTLDGFNNRYATVMANYETQAAFADADFREYIRTSLYIEKYFNLVTADVAGEQDMVWARHILVKTEEEAKDILAKLDAGEDFGSLAAQFSLDTSNSNNGGDLGWFFHGMMVQEFDDAAYALKVGEVSAPVKTEFGYHIIQSLGHEIRQRSQETVNQLKSDAYQAKVNELIAAAASKKFNLWASVIPNSPAIPAEYRIAQ